MKVNFRGEELRLKALNDRDYSTAERLARHSGVPLDQCPTCGAKDEEIPGSQGVKIFTNGVYKFRGEEHFCECQAQMALRARYLVANIGAQYMTLDWADYEGPQEIKDSVALYLDKWKNFKHQGMGVEFGGAGLGTGKTFGATYIGKELIKRGQKVFFVPFIEVVSAFQMNDGGALERRMLETTYLILDELLPATSGAQHDLYAHRLEALIRHRTNHNLPTILTTNLTEKQLHDHYPRTYSLLEAKQLRIDMSGADARKNKMGRENLELAANDEVRPIT